MPSCASPRRQSAAPTSISMTATSRECFRVTFSCGACFFCQQALHSLCENSNPNAWLAEKLLGHSPAGLFGYSHLLGGYAGGQAQYARIPFADVGPIKVPGSLSDE